MRDRRAIASLKRLLLLLALCELFAFGSSAQSVAVGEHILRDSVLKKQRFLRGFNGDDEVRWHWTGTTLVQAEPAIHTLGVLVARSVKVKGNVIRIEGGRRTLLRTGKTNVGLSGAEEDVQLIVDITGADVTELLPKLADILFYATPQEMFADIPEKYRSSVPADVKQGCCSVKEPVPAKCDCADPNNSPCSSNTAKLGTSGLTPPKVITSGEPEFSDSARNAHFSGTVTFELDIDKTGLPQNLWLLKPAGLGLDANAAKAVRMYRFSPALCHGSPVVTTLFLDTNFNMP